MSAPAVVDGIEFARSEQHASGRLFGADLARLQDLMFDEQYSLEYEIQGCCDERGRPQFKLHIFGRLHLRCQRCLTLLDYPLDVSNSVLLVTKGSQAEDDELNPEEPDAIEASPELDIAALLEDEVLLSLPLSPRHRDGACSGRAGTASIDIAGIKPFAQLAKLKPGQLQ